MSQVSTTITIQFGDNAESQGFLTAEIDSRSDGLNAGRSQFQPEEVVWFLVYAGPNVSYDAPVLSDGVLMRGSDVLVPQDEVISFANTKEGKLGKPAEGAIKLNWYGTSLGSSKLGSDKMTLVTEKVGVAVASVKYSARAKAWGIKAPKTSGGAASFPVAVFILGKTQGS